MDYNDFWFIETRNQTTNLKRWFLWGILLFVFVSVGVYFCIRSIYRTVDNYEIDAINPAVRVVEAKATNVNGYVKGEVKNLSQEEIRGKYIKFAFFTKNENNIGNEYIEIGNLAVGESKTYEVKFRYNNIERFVVTITDEKE